MKSYLVPSKHLGQPLLRISPIVSRKFGSTHPSPLLFGLINIRSKPKSAANEKPRSAAVTKAAAATTNGATKGKPARARKPGRTGGPKKKTAQELDAEMSDYFGTGEDVSATGAAQPVAVANGDAGMVDEVM